MNGMDCNIHLGTYELESPSGYWNENAKLLHTNGIKNYYTGSTICIFFLLQSLESYVMMMDHAKVLEKYQLMSQHASD